MSSNQHARHKRQSSEKRVTSTIDMTSNKYKINDKVNSVEKLSKRHGLNINLSATPIKSLSKNTTRAQTSRPALNTIDIAYNNERHNFVSNNGYNNKQRKSYSIAKSKRSRFKKRISAPIVLPTSTTQSLRSATANLPTNRNIGSATPYYSNMDECIDLLSCDKEINKMIKTNKYNNGRPRAYSKTRKISELDLLDNYNEENDSSSDESDSDDETKHDYHNTLRKYGYIEVCVIAKSLQGIVIKAKRIHETDTNNNETVIIKITNKNLHINKISNKHGKSLSVEEDIIKEKKLLMYLTANNGPKELVKFLGFFSDKYNYYLVMENGGSDFFDWIVKCHKWIRDGKLSLKQWNLYIHDLMFQIIKLVKWLHCKMNVCHLDISLENMLIKNNKYKSDGNGGIRLSRKMQIKICDFGLAEYFDTNSNSKFLCKKYVGKTHYKAPKVYGKKETFDARKADIWSLGVSFFMMIIGAPPYKLPIDSDDHFPLIKQNNIMGILKRWGRDHYINKNTEILLNNMLHCNEHKRLSIIDIENHLYFNTKNTYNILSNISYSLPKSYNNSRSYNKLKYKNKNKQKQKHKQHRHSIQGSTIQYNKYKHKKPSNPIHSNIMATYHQNCILMETPQNNNNIFQNLVMSQDDGQLFRYRKRKLTST